MGLNGILPFRPALRISLSLMKMERLMKTKLSSSAPSQLDTECLVVVALDRGSKDKPEVGVDIADEAVKKAVAEVIANGEATGKNCEVTLIHHPTGVKARRLLLLGGGKAANFSGFELRRLAGTAVRTLKSRACAALPSRSRWPDADGGQGRSSKAPSSATSIPTTTRATARTRRSTRSPSSTRGDRPGCKRQWTKPASSASRRTSPATW